MCDLYAAVVQEQEKSSQVAIGVVGSGNLLRPHIPASIIVPARNQRSHASGGVTGKGQVASLEQQMRDLQQELNNAVRHPPPLTPSLDCYSPERIWMSLHPLILEIPPLHRSC